MAGDIELPESISMAMGGMIGSGIFAVLGPVVLAAGTLTWFSVLVAGLLILCAAYSFVHLNDVTDDPESPVLFVGRFTGNTTLAGMTGWTFVIGYVGTSALYAYAFGIYFTTLLGVKSVSGVPLQPLITLAAVVGFVGLNLAGAQTSGQTEKLIVGIQLLILAVFGLISFYYGFTHNTIHSGLSQFDISPLIAAAIAVVGFEGWELLYFDQDEIADPETTTKTAITVSILSMVVLFGIIGVVTANLVSTQMLQQHAETVLLFVTQSFLGQIWFVVIGIAALLSTGSALNATVFSAARLLKGLVTKDLMPGELTSSADIPLRPLLVLGVPTALLSVLGSLSAISSFSSLAFIILFGSISAIAVSQRDSVLTAVIPSVGTVGASLGAIALLYHLYTNSLGVFVIVLVLAVAVIAAELLYFEREPLIEGAKNAKEKAEEKGEDAKEKGEDAKEKGEDAKEKGEDAKEKVEEKGNDAKEKVEEATEKGEDAEEKTEETDEE